MYLNKVEFPYATEQEIALMEDVVTRAFKNVNNDAEMNKVNIYYTLQMKTSRP